MPVIDSHVHMYHPACMDYFRNYREKYGFDYVNFACFCCGEAKDKSPVQNLMAAAMKLSDPHFFAHAGLAYPSIPVVKPIPEEWEFSAQAAELLDMGFDGVKILETKPTCLKADKVEICDPIYDKFFALLEERGTHIIWHACDPETFWDADTAPEFSFKEGWFYGDGTFPTKEEIYRQVYTVLDRHPKLNASFAHFYFLSDFPEIAEKFLATYPNVSLDITPGREMYDYFSRRRDVWKDFFTRHADRIVFGTDMTADEFQGDVGDILSTMRRFLETDDMFTFWDFEIRGLALPKDAVDKICGNNFARMTGAAPKAMDKKKLAAYVEKALPLVQNADDKAFLTDFFAKNL